MLKHLILLLFFISIVGTGKSDEKVDLTRENKLAQFNNWFTWCHICRHGGHAGHMLSWFRWEVQMFSIQKLVLLLSDHLSLYPHQ